MITSKAEKYENVGTCSNVVFFDKRILIDNRLEIDRVSGEVEKI